MWAFCVALSMSCPGISAKRIFPLDDPGIHVFLTENVDVDGWDKPAMTM
jgi:hypothetical protein